MKKLLFILALLAGFAANAQDMSYGVTARFGAFTTLGDNGNSGNNSGYGIGVQAALGAWVKLPLTVKSNVQFTLLQMAERQSAGEITLIDENRNPITDATVTDRNLGLALQAFYFYTLDEQWSIGTGAGAKYEYLSKAKVEAKYTGWNYSKTSKETFDNTYRRNLTVNLPVEVQYTFNDQITVVGQVQLQLSNRLKPAETKYKEHDLGATIGVNYTLY